MEAMGAPTGKLHFAHYWHANATKELIAGVIAL